MRKLFFSASLVFLLLVAVPHQGIFGLFTSESSAADNTFSTAAVFPSPSPSLIPTPSPSSSPTSSPSPSGTPLPTPPPEAQFPVCPAEPGADVNGQKWNVGYAEGIHWIVFNGLHFGSDYVYYLNGKDKVLQCYYPIPSSETGIQTNWLKKTTDLPNWQEWSNGADFGLNSGPYLIQNINFSTVQNSPSPSPSPSNEPEQSESSSSAEVTN